jgi:hypothetical protein
VAFVLFEKAKPETFPSRQLIRGIALLQFQGGQSRHDVVFTRTDVDQFALPNHLFDDAGKFKSIWMGAREQVISNVIANHEHENSQSTSHLTNRNRPSLSLHLRPFRAFKGLSNSSFDTADKITRLLDDSIKS